MKTAGTHSSYHFFTAVLIGAGILLVMPVIYGKEYPPMVTCMNMLFLLVLTCLVLLRNTRQAQKDLEENNRQLSQHVKELGKFNDMLEGTMQERAKSLMTLQTQLLQSEKFSAIGQLAAGVAHEINNPVGFINSNLQTLQQYVAHYTRLLEILNKLEKALKDKDQQRAAEVVASWEKTRKETNFAFMGGDIENLLKESMEGAGKIGKIVSDLRTLASPDRGNLVSVNVETLMDSMLNIVHNEIKYKAELKQDYTHVPLIMCNPQKIGQVFVNLLMNATQAIEGKGTIMVKTYTKDTYVCIDVSDTGCGIAPENITKIFDPLFTTKAPGAGVGLGLSVSYDIVRKHHGTIRFNSKLGEGTTFTVMLPLAIPAHEPQLLWRDYERD